MGFSDVARVNGLPECVVGGWKESFDAPGGPRLVGSVDEVKDVLLGIEFGAEGSWMVVFSGPSMQGTISQASQFNMEHLHVCALKIVPLVPIP